MSRAVVLALVAAAGCALAPVRPEGFVCPVRGGPPWTQVRTEHFLLRTDLPPATAGAFARELEGVHATYRAFFGGRAPEGVVPVTAFRTALAYRELGLPDSQAITLVGEPGLRVVIAASPARRRDGPRAEAGGVVPRRAQRPAPPVPDGAEALNPFRTTRL